MAWEAMPARRFRRKTPMPRGDSSAGFYRAAWMIVAQGGWWRPREIVEQLPLDIDASTAHHLLWCMSKRHGHLVARGAYRSREYAVTAGCTAPAGVSVGDIVLAITGRPFAHAKP